MGKLAVQLAIAALIFYLPVAAPATIYKSIGPDGQVIYSDQPQPGAKEIELPPEVPPSPPSVIAPEPTPTMGKTPGKVRETPTLTEKPPVTGYNKLAIIKPENDEAVRANNGVVDVDLALEPALDTKAGHQIAVTLDGKELPDIPASTQFQLNNVDRGTHSLQAQIIDAEGKVLARSNTVTFHLQRISALILKKNNRLTPGLMTPGLIFPTAPE